MHAPRELHFQLIKHIFRFGVQLTRSSSHDLVAYSNTDWVGCPDTRCSTSGYCIFLGDNLLSWSLKHQHTVSRSNVGAEYHGVANAIAEACWLRQLLVELHQPLRKATMSTMTTSVPCISPLISCSTNARNMWRLTFTSSMNVWPLGMFEFFMCHLRLSTPIYSPKERRQQCSTTSDPVSTSTKLPDDPAGGC